MIFYSDRIAVLLSAQLARQPERGVRNLPHRQHGLKYSLQRALGSAIRTPPVVHRQIQQDVSSVASAVGVDRDEVVRDDEDHGGDAEAIREVGEGSVRNHLMSAAQSLSKLEDDRVEERPLGSILYTTTCMPRKSMLLTSISLWMVGGVTRRAVDMATGVEVGLARWVAGPNKPVRCRHCSGFISTHRLYYPARPWPVFAFLSCLAFANREPSTSQRTLPAD